MGMHALRGVSGNGGGERRKTPAAAYPKNRDMTRALGDDAKGRAASKF